MIRLSLTTSKLQALLSGAVTTNQLPISVFYSDKTTTAYNGNAQLTNTNNTTPVDICDSPAASTIRDIDHISIRNNDTASATVTVRYNANSVLFTLVAATLAVGDHLVYTHGAGWQTYNSAGAIKHSVVPIPAVEVSYSPTGDIAATEVQSAITELDTEKAPKASPSFTGNATFGGNILPTDAVTKIGGPSNKLAQLYTDYTDTGVVGAVTINKMAGRVNIAAGGTSVVVTNSLVTAASKVIAIAATNDATAHVSNVVRSAGSFTINVTATTAQTAFDFIVFNTD